MDRPTSDIRVVLAAVDLETVLKLRELALSAGLTRLTRDTDNELRRRSTPEIETRLRPYRATLHRIV